MKSPNKYKRILYVIINWMLAFGFDLRGFLLAIRRFPSVLKDFWVIKNQNNKNQEKWNLYFSLPFMRDKDEAGGVASGHYFQQDLLVAKKIFLRNPVRHIDLGSRIDGFVAHVAVFRPIEVLDIRPLEVNIANISFRQCNLLMLPENLFNCCDSLSCLHALEHVGLGRYGDAIDVNGYKRGFENLSSMLARDGVLYLSLPIGNERIEFNAHRVFAIKTIIELSKDRLKLIDFSFVDDCGNLHESIALRDDDIKNNFKLKYGCGIFEFRKL